MTSNPHHELQHAWDVYKRSHVNVKNELQRAYRTANKAASDLHWGQARSWHREAVHRWEMACEEVLGSPVQIEWVGSADMPQCIVNGVMMFA